MYSKGTCYSDTSKAVNDANIILESARRQYQRAQELVEKQRSARGAESVRTEASIATKHRVASQLQAPGQVAMTAVVRAIEQDVVDLVATTEALNNAVLSAQRTYAATKDRVQAQENTLEFHRAERHRSLDMVDRIARTLGAQLEQMETEVAAMDREISTLGENNEFLQAQLSVRLKKASSRTMRDVGAPTPESRNGYVCVPDV